MTYRVELRLRRAEELYTQFGKIIDYFTHPPQSMRGRINLADCKFEVSPDFRGFRTTFFYSVDDVTASLSFEEEKLDIGKVHDIRVIITSNKNHEKVRRLKRTLMARVNELIKVKK